MRLLLKTVVVAFCFKHHGHPVISCVNRWLFKASATYSFHKFCISCRTNQRAGNSLPRATEKELVYHSKRDAAFHLRVLR
jgi:hypothetical protein